MNGNGVERETQSTSDPDDVLGQTWLMQNLSPVLANRILINPYVPIYKSLISPRGVQTFSGSLPRYVYEGYAAADIGIYSAHMEKGSPAASFVPFYFLPRESPIDGELKLRAFLLRQLGHNLGYGFDLETLAREFIRTPKMRIGQHFPPEAVEQYILTPSGKQFKPTDQRPVAHWTDRDWLDFVSSQEILSPEELATLQTALTSGEQPYVNFRDEFDAQTPLSAFPDWGVDLRSLSSAEIYELAEHGLFCQRGCRGYHTNTGLYKQEELVAEVETKLFGERLLPKIRERLTARRAGQIATERKLIVLIPAQADETTITGVINYLVNQGISYTVLSDEVSLILADRCVTPLLKIKATHKDSILDKQMQLVSMNALSWGQNGDYDPIDFACADHLLELFPLEDPRPSELFPRADQRHLLLSLIGSLARGGELVLTTRCGISQEELMQHFYERVDLRIAQKLDSLEYFASRDDAVSPPSEQLLERLVEVRNIFALLEFRRDRQVYPFPTQNTLEDLVREVERELGRPFTYQIDNIRPGKVRLIITADEWTG